MKYGGETGGMRGFAGYRSGTWTDLAGVSDGASNTILVGEGLPDQDASSCLWDGPGSASGVTIPINWYTGEPYAGFGAGAPWNARGSYAARGFKSHHTGGANFLMADGSIRFIKESISPPTYAALGSRAGGEPISNEAF